MRLDHFVGLEYTDKGRNFSGVDCYGLLYLVYKETQGIVLPSYVTDYVNSVDRKATADLIAGKLDPWEKVAKGSEIKFDAILIRIGRDVMHVGLVAEPGKMLHIQSGELSRIEPYRTGIWQHRIAGFYRYRGS